MPLGLGFVPFPTFEGGYEALKQATNGFTKLDHDAICQTITRCPIAFVVLRAVLGLTPPEWAYVAAQETKTDIPQGFIRTLDRRIRSRPLEPLRSTPESTSRIRKLVAVACRLLEQGAPDVDPNQLHRLNKADTKAGLVGIQNAAQMGVPYAMLLYERFLGRPFAGHRDSVSEIIGDGLESAIEEVLSRAGISARKTKRAEKIPGFDQTPDFMIPSEFNPQVVIEAKITEYDGTARDKVTRVQHLGELSRLAAASGKPGFEVIACIGGRGFGVRREDMKKMLFATRGKVFTLKTIERLVDCTRLIEFRTK
ncbi:MAG: hypothetical protein AABO41_14435 [Acidobacteriota bacterium]